MVGQFWSRYATDDGFSDNVDGMIHDLIADKVEEVLSDPDKASKFFAGLSANAAFGAVGARGQIILVDAAGNLIIAQPGSLAELRMLENISRSVPDRVPPLCRMEKAARTATVMVHRGRCFAL